MIGILVKSNIYEFSCYNVSDSVLSIAVELLKDLVIYTNNIQIQEVEEEKF